MTHDGEVFSVAFSPDGKYVVSGGGDNTPRVWETDTGEEVARLYHDNWLYSVAFSPNGKYVVSGGVDNTARAWVWQPKDLIANACTTMPRNLTLAEWRQYVGVEIPYEVICDPEIYPNAIIPEDAQVYLDSQ